MSNSRESLLWEIRNPVKPDKNYLFGSIHIMDSRAFRFTAHVLPLIENCDIYASELNLDEIDHLAWQQMMALPQHLSMSEILGKKYYKRLLRFNAQYLRLPELFLQRHCPFMIINMMSQAYFKSDQAQNLDSFLFYHAKSQGKKMEGLELFEDQLDLMKRIDLDLQTQSLKKALKHINKFKKQHDQALCYYEKQEIRQLYKSSRNSLGHLRKYMIRDRNIKMARRFNNLLKEGSIFASVGAAHLSGKDGLLRLLKKSGLQVRPILMELSPELDVSGINTNEKGTRDSL